MINPEKIFFPDLMADNLRYKGELIRISTFFSEET